MKILARTTISQEAIKKLRERIERENLFAICYAIEYPRNAKDFQDVYVDEDGIIFADSFKDYRSKIHAIVEPSGCPESSFRFYTTYNTDLSDREYVYYTYFNLNDPVQDSRFMTARKYLLDTTDRLTKILRDDIPTLSDILIYIQWDLQSEDQGCIYMATTDTLTSDELDQVSQWVKSQNSDGIGESFAQTFQYNDMNENPQDYGDEELDDYDLYQESQVTPEFDWKWNDYRFKLLN